MYVYITGHDGAPPSSRCCGGHNRIFKPSSRICGLPIYGNTCGVSAFPRRTTKRPDWPVDVPYIEGQAARFDTVLVLFCVVVPLFVMTSTAHTMLSLIAGRTSLVTLLKMQHHVFVIVILTSYIVLLGGDKQQFSMSVWWPSWAASAGKCVTGESDCGVFSALWPKPWEWIRRRRTPVHRLLCQENHDNALCTAIQAPWDAASRLLDPRAACHRINTSVTEIKWCNRQMVHSVANTAKLDDAAFYRNRTPQDTTEGQGILKRVFEDKQEMGRRGRALALCHSQPRSYPTM